MQHRIRAEALTDLTDIYREGVARFGVPQAERYAAGFRQVFVTLTRRPRDFRLREEFIPPIRAVRYQSHMIFYDVESDGTVIILRVRHGREDWQSSPV